MKRSLIRKLAVITVLPLTAFVFIYYFKHHPEVRQQLGHTPLSLLALLLGLYLLSIVALSFVTFATLRLCRIKADRSENLLLTAYTAVINFFGPLQSGPAFRAVCLKKKYELDLKKYAGASLVYYFFWGAFSGLMLLSGVLKWWLIPLAAVGFGGGLLLLKTPKAANRLKGLDLHAWYYLALATLAQVLIVSVIYYAELIHVAPGTTFSQAVIYTGAANLALFVSLTPGAIGFRESFLLFSQHLHHVSNSSIVAASILDRAVYIIFLLGLAAFILASHAGKRLKAAS